MDRDDIQGLVLDDYRNQPFARFHLLGFGAGEPRQVLARLVNEISSSAEARASFRLHFALTASGLGALGLSAQVLAQFSREFRQGMAHPERSVALGDVGDDAPAAWEFGGPTTPPVDALCLTYARTREQLAERCFGHERQFERFGMTVHRYDAEALPGASPSAESARPAPRVPRNQRVPRGEFVLGERDVVGERQRGPFVPVKYGTRPMPEWARRERALDFGQSGSYLVLRKLTADAPLELAPDAWPAAKNAELALEIETSRAHRVLRRSRRLSDGLWFMALNASIRRQFEWSAGLAAGDSRQFRVRGGAYFFLPGIRALNYLAEPGG